MHARNTAILAAIGFIFIFVFDWVYHGIILKGVYEQTAYLWRSPEVMRQMMGFMLLGQLMLAFAAALLFPHGYKGGGMGEGVKFGFYLGTIGAAMHIMSYAYLPVPFGLVLAWVLCSYLTAIGLGVIFARLYNNI